jgi:hypothetical protein
MWTIVCLLFFLFVSFVLRYVSSGSTHVVFRLSLSLSGLKLSLYIVRILYFAVFCLLIRLHPSQQAYSTTWQALLYCKYQMNSIFPCCNLQGMNMLSQWYFFLYLTIIYEMWLWKETQDGQQFHQYQETHLSPQNHWLQYRPRHIKLEIQVLARAGQKRSFDDISGMVDLHCLHFLFIISTSSVI